MVAFYSSPHQVGLIELSHFGVFYQSFNVVVGVVIEVIYNAAPVVARVQVNDLGECTFYLAGFAGAE